MVKEGARVGMFMSDSALFLNFPLVGSLWFTSMILANNTSDIYALWGPWCAQQY